MKKIIYLNPKDIIKVQVFDKTEISVQRHEQVQQKKNFWGVITQHGCDGGYSSYGGIKKTPEDLIKYHSLHGEVITYDKVEDKFYRQPRIEVTYSYANSTASGSEVEYFETYESVVAMGVRLGALAGLVPIFTK